MLKLQLLNQSTMYKYFLFLLFASVTFISCQNDDGQNLDINVTGKVTDQNNNGVSNVTIYIQRGKGGWWSSTVYNQYETVTTNTSGNYHYLVKNDSYSYKICCGIPPGFSDVDEFCQNVNHNIQNGHTFPNIINFKLIP